MEQAFSFQVGANASQTISLTIKDFETEASSASAGVFDNIDATAYSADGTNDLDALDVQDATILGLRSLTLTMPC